MPNYGNNKIKLLYLMKILMEKSDESHALTINDIIIEIERYGFTAERKTIYEDIGLLRQFGIDIITRKNGRSHEYFVGSRTFELPELKLLVDAVQSSKFITTKKSRLLIKKIESLASLYEAKQLDRQVFVTNRVKTMNEGIYYNVDRLYLAITENKQISFKYFEYAVNKEMKFRKNGEKYVTSPYFLSWDDENYYLVSFSNKYRDFTHYRVDKMTDIEILDQLRTEIPEEKNFNIADYSKSVFNMFGGEEEIVKIQFDNSLVNVVIDRFGKDIMIEQADEFKFVVKLKVAVSSAFFAWVFQFENKARILEPGWIVEQFKERINRIINQY